MTWTQIGIFAAAVLVELGRALTHENVSAWSDAVTPAIVGGAILSLGLQISGILSRPSAKP